MILGITMLRFFIYFAKISVQKFATTAAKEMLQKDVAWVDGETNVTCSALNFPRRFLYFSSRFEIRLNSHSHSFLKSAKLRQWL